MLYIYVPCPVVVKLTFSYANLLAVLDNCVYYCKTLGLCICLTAAYPMDLRALSVASRSCQAGAALLILFYLRAPLNINVVFSPN